MIIATNPHIGNYGVNDKETESNSSRFQDSSARISVSTIHVPTLPKVWKNISKAKPRLHLRCRYARAHRFTHVTTAPKTPSSAPTERQSSKLKMKLAQVPDMKGLELASKFHQTTVFLR
jgi:carbamoyl-phosphate synthase small subunit